MICLRKACSKDIDMKTKLIRLSAKKDASITKAAKSDPNSRPLTDKEWIRVKSRLSRGCERFLGREKNNK